jgi:hypothetical protein
MNGHTSIAAFIKDALYLLSGFQIADLMRAASEHLGFNLVGMIPLLESRAIAACISAVIAGLFMLAARRMEARLTNKWRRRAMEAESRLVHLTTGRLEAFDTDAGRIIKRGGYDYTSADFQELFEQRARDVQRDGDKG